MNSNQIMECISSIALTPGKNDKQAFLSLAMEDSQFGKTMLYAYSPFITFGVRPARFTGEHCPDHPMYTGVWTDETWQMLDDLATRKLTGNAALSAIGDQYSALDVRSAELLWRVLNKDMKAGFTENSINKVSKDFIPSSPYERCSLPKDVDFEAWPWATGVISQIKADGMFFNGIVEPTLVSFTSRQGQPFPTEGFEGLMEAFYETFKPLLTSHPEFANGLNTHGELLVLDSEGNVCAREVGNGLINKLIKGTLLPKGYELSAVLWDVIPKDKAVKKGQFDQPYVTRLRTLNAAISLVQAKRLNHPISVIETRVVRSYEEAMEHYYDARRRKLEGTIAKKPGKIWKDGTSKDQVKLKQEVPVELEVYDFEEGKEGGKTADTFGSLKCKTSCGMLKVNVGSGFTDEQRREINENRWDWIGAIITVKANEIMYAKRGKIEHSLFLPIFVERRFDKQFADSFAEVERQFENAIK
jgi:DNA ligase-1